MHHEVLDRDTRLVDLACGLEKVDLPLRGITIEREVVHGLHRFEASRRGPKLGMLPHSDDGESVASVHPLEPLDNVEHRPSDHGDEHGVEHDVEVSGLRGKVGVLAREEFGGNFRSLNWSGLFRSAFFTCSVVGDCF